MPSPCPTESRRRFEGRGATSWSTEAACSSAARPSACSESSNRNGSRSTSLIRLGILAGKIFDAPIRMVADGLGAPLQEIRGFYEPVLAPASYDIACGTIEKGTVAAMRYGLEGIVGGRPAFVIEHVTRTRADLAPDWPQGRGWSVDVEGEPSMRCSVQIATDGGDENDQATLGTAMHAVNAIPLVCEAPPGIRTFLDLPMILGRRSIRP